MKKLLVVPILLVVVFAYPAFADPGPTDEVEIVLGNCDDGTTILRAHNTTDIELGWLIRIDGRLVDKGRLAPDERVERIYDVALGESHFYRIRLGLLGEGVYYSTEGTTDRTNCPTRARALHPPHRPAIFSASAFVSSALVPASGRRRRLDDLDAPRREAVAVPAPRRPRCSGAPVPAPGPCRSRAPRVSRGSWRACSRSWCSARSRCASHRGRQPPSAGTAPTEIRDLAHRAGGFAAGPARLPGAMSGSDIRYDGKTALIVVDLQNDFADPSGSLSVREGELVVPVANREISAAGSAGSYIVYSQDWHPPTTPHFEKDGGLWPVHCVQGSWGATFHPDLQAVGDVVHKGDQGADGYSAFSERDPLSGETAPTILQRLLQEHDVERLVVCGLATDFCVVETVTDARDLGYDVVVVRDGIRAVDRKAGAGERAIQRMREAGADVT